YNGAKIAQGRDAAKQFMRDNPEIALELEQKIKERITSGSSAAKPAGASLKVAGDDDSEDDF
ncbi:MAG: DNA recombination/repair protein RecA, partial [Saprospiraceae bacterium]|nr:DNA recombination/repair protein RecA [Saprospiraceae bacterium]